MQPASNPLRRGESLAWLAGLACLALPCALVASRESFEPLSTLAWVGFSTATCLAILVAMRANARVSAARCAWAAGAGFGVLVGILAAQPTPTNWFMSDVAWHVAKVALAAEGAPLQDPILRVETIYPFVFHLALAPFAALGASPVEVLRWTTPVLVAALGWSWLRLQRALFDPVPAAWGALALPLFLYAPTAGFAFLPNPFNASLPLAFLGLSLLVEDARDDVPPARWRLPAGGAVLGVAGLLWYGHLPWLVALVALRAIRQPRGAIAVAAGALPCAIVLIAHLARLEHALTPGIAASEAPAWGERLPGMLRNLFTLSGPAALDAAPSWIGPALILVVAWSVWRREPSPAAHAWPVTWTLPLVGACLVFAGVRMQFWLPFSWRYGFLLFALALALAGRARTFAIGPWLVTPAALAALAAPWWAANSALERLNVSRLSRERFSEGPDRIASYLRAHTRRDEPVFASVDTWDLAIGCAEARPNLVARSGGVYNFAPAEFVAPRWAAYQELLAAPDAASARSLLAPYGFRLAVISEKDRAQPGLAALAEGFESVLDAGVYRIVDLERPR